MQVVLTIKPKRCILRFGIGNCQAVYASGETAQHKCYNTRTTCRDLPNIELVPDEQSLVFTTDNVERREVIESRLENLPTAATDDAHDVRFRLASDGVLRVGVRIGGGAEDDPVYESGVLVGNVSSGLLTAIFGPGEPDVPPRDSSNITPADLPGVLGYITTSQLVERVVAYSVPAIKSALIQSGMLAFEGLASENKAVINLNDETTIVDPDDPYSDERANCGGSRWGRLIARDKLLHSATATLEFKEVGDTVWTLTHWQVESITEPRNGIVVLKLTDPITRKLKQPYPPEQSKALAADTTESSTAMPVVVADDEPEYWRIGSEILRFNNNAWQRGQLGTEAAEHSNGDSVSPVRVFDEKPWHEAFKEVLDDAVPDITDADDIDTKAAATHGMKVRVIAHRAEPFKDTLAQLCMAGQCAIYYDIFSGRLRHRPTTIFELPDATIGQDDIIGEPPLIQTLVKLQRTRASYKFKLSNPTDNRSYTRHAVAVDGDAEARLGYEMGDVLENQYAVSGDAAAARRIQRYADLPIEAAMVVDASEYTKQRTNGGGAICELGELMALNYPEGHQGVDGCAETLKGHIKQFAIDLIKGSMTLKLMQLTAFERLSNTIQVSITSDATDVDLFNLAGQPYIPGLTINVDITDGVVIGGVTSDAFRISGFAPDTIININCPGECWMVGRAGKGGGGGRYTTSESSLEMHGPWSGDGNNGGNGQSGTRGMFISGAYIINFNGVFYVYAGGGGGGGGARGYRAGGGAGGWAGGFRQGQIFLPGGAGGGSGGGEDRPGNAGTSRPDALPGFRGWDAGDPGGPDGGDAGDGTAYTDTRSGGGGGGGGGSSTHSNAGDGDDAVGLIGGLKGTPSWHGVPGDGGNGAWHFVNVGGNATLDLTAASIKVGTFDVVVSEATEI